MNLKSTFLGSLAVFFVGLVYFFAFAGSEAGMWFTVGGGLALVNLGYALWIVRRGLASVQNKAFFLFLLMFKTLTFMTLVAVILIFVKPLVLPFTLGVTLVIFGAVLAALWESKRYLRGSNAEPE